MVDYLNRMVNELFNIPHNVVVRSLDIDEDGRYWITSDKMVLSVCREEARYKHFRDNGSGYYQTCINGKYYYLHRLLAFAFTPDKIKKLFQDFLEVHHIDRNRSNNDLSNLAIVSKAKHKRIHYAWNKLDSWRKIPWEDMEQEQRITQIRELYK